MLPHVVQRKSFLHLSWVLGLRCSKWSPSQAWLMPCCGVLISNNIGQGRVGMSAQGLFSCSRCVFLWLKSVNSSRRQVVYLVECAFVLCLYSITRCFFNIFHHLPSSTPRSEFDFVCLFPCCTPNERALFICDLRLCQRSWRLTRYTINTLLILTVTVDPSPSMYVCVMMRGLEFTLVKIDDNI